MLQDQIDWVSTGAYTYPVEPLADGLDQAHSTILDSPTHDLTNPFPFTFEDPEVKYIPLSLCRSLHIRFLRTSSTNVVVIHEILSSILPNQKSFHILLSRPRSSIGRIFQPCRITLHLYNSIPSTTSAFPDRDLERCLPLFQRRRPIEKSKRRCSLLIRRNQWNAHYRMTRPPPTAHNQ